MTVHYQQLMAETISMTAPDSQPVQLTENQPVSPVKHRGFAVKKVVNWDAIKEDYTVKFLSVKEIEEKYGVKPMHLYQVSRRKGWQRVAGPVGQAARKAAKAVIDQAINRQIAHVRPAVEQAVKEWQDRTLSLAETARAKVGQHLSSELDVEELKTSVATLDTVDKVGRRTLGLDREAGDAGSARVAVAVRLELLGLGESGLSVSPPVVDVGGAAQLGEG